MPREGIGNPRCEHCHGAGVIRMKGSYTKCVCVSGSAAARNSVRRLNSIGTEFNLERFKDNRKGKHGGY